MREIMKTYFLSSYATPPVTKEIFTTDATLLIVVFFNMFYDVPEGNEW